MHLKSPSTFNNYNTLKNFFKLKPLPMNKQKIIKDFMSHTNDLI